MSYINYSQILTIYLSLLLGYFGHEKNYFYSVNVLKLKTERELQTVSFAVLQFQGKYVFERMCVQNKLEKSWNSWLEFLIFISLWLCLRKHSGQVHYQVNLLVFHGQNFYKCSVADFTFLQIYKL